MVFSAPVKKEKVEEEREKEKEKMTSLMGEEWLTR